MERIQDIFSDKKNIARVGALILFVIAIAAVLIFKPFAREQGQLQELRTITESEKGADSLSSQFGGFVDREKSLKQIIAASPSPAAGIENSGGEEYTAFDAGAIDSEARRAQVYELQTEHTTRIFEDFAYFYTHLYAN